MEAAAVGATIKVLIQNLISVSMKEKKLIGGFKNDLEKLRSTLNTIQEFVNGAEVLQVTDVSVQQWMKKLEDVALEADNILDEVDYLSLRTDRHKIEAKTSIKKKFKSFTSASSGSNFKLGHKIKDINKAFESINREASGLGLQTRLSALHATGVGLHASATEETDSYTCDSVFLGRSHDVKEIVEKLNNIPIDEHVFYILPIVGMGGIGKSSLAREVVKVQNHFVTHIWVHVSANFDPVTIFKKILTILTSEDVKVDNREVVLKRLKEALADKTYLLVLDDLRNEERLKWEGFVNSLSGITSTKGNAIIVTTRNGNVASIVATLAIHELKGLQKESCLSIIKAKSFGGDMILSEFEIIGRNLAERCQGLPLAANVVGGVLRGKSKDEWLSIKENWLSDHIEGDFIQKVLKLSFDNLPSASLKKCFAYCSIFPKGARMMRVDLIQLWMAEGYLEADQKSDMEAVGNNFFNLLLHNSLLQVVERDPYNNVLLCSMHDLVHDVAMKLNDNISGGIYRVRYTANALYADESKEKTKYVRTLFLSGISDATFSNFKSLHALTLMGDDVKELPSSIRELIHLRYLNISETHISDIPDTIGELCHMQTLRAYSFFLKKLPSTIKWLICLRHLHVSDHTKLPGELGMLTSLQTIPYFAVGDEKGHRIAELKSMKNLKGTLKIYNLEKVKDKPEAMSACVFQKLNIVKLVLWWNESKECETNYTDVLEGLQPHLNLKSLEIVGFKGAQFPSWVLKMGVRDECHWKGLNNLMEIRLESCSECEEIPMMGHLPNLKSLYLLNMRNVKSIGSSFYGIDHCISNNDTIIVFPALERLELRDMPKMREWVQVELARSASKNKVKVFPCLEYLKIRYCKQLKFAPRHFTCLKELEIKDMDSGLPLENICGTTNLKSLTNLKIRGLVELYSLPRKLFYNNKNLSELSIRGCRKLRKLADGLHTLNSLQVLNIEHCPSLESIPDCSGGSFTSLRSLVIEDCGELMNLPAEMVESCAPSLECLQLGDLRRVMNMQMVIDCLHKMPRLTKLELASLPKFVITCSTKTPTLRSLRELRMGPDSDSWDCVSFKKAVDGILGLGCHSLGILKLRGKEDWESLPDQLQRLSAISILRLSDFGIQELPEWFGNLSSLYELSLCNCKRLTSLPSTEAMRRLTNLVRLDIRGCLLLKERGIEQPSDEHDSQ